MEGFIFEVNSSEASKAVSLSHVQFNSFPHADSDLTYWYIIWNVSTTNWGLNLKSTLCRSCIWSWGVHAKHVFLFNIFTGACNLYFDALIIKLFYICLVMGLGEGTLSKVFVDVSRLRWGVTLASGGRDKWIA